MVQRRVLSWKAGYTKQGFQGSEQGFLMESRVIQGSQQGFHGKYGVYAGFRAGFFHGQQVIQSRVSRVLSRALS